ncbi:flagellar protein FlaG [Thauera linaloolentis]|uniref:Flagellar protein n=1 Tax=Thauera linaloolentis (strain DSM 12138 / JCM 21573 / CCUG 41526 / CIP 105981 / IAM 15112 / NBRC 102519 / 47Lol) TaxID=1123367 RepID=N6Y5K9_THAL4|nr:flagellar protein FlaG [Thauera linaloolentis]ENO86855.1 flagellar protein [Thauera linaloolentis 47Lol = DSM 12138]MCM8567107.1 flagellar protein FlaG [Thauera linaloolentis]
MSIESIGNAIPQTTRILSQATQSSPAATTAPLPATAIPVEAASTETAAAASARQPDAAQITQAVEEVRAAITPVAQNLHFSIDKDINRTIVKVVDASTDEVIRQIPSEEIIAIAKAVDKLQGLLIKQEA